MSHLHLYPLWQLAWAWKQPNSRGGRFSTAQAHDPVEKQVQAGEQRVACAAQTKQGAKVTKREFAALGPSGGNGSSSWGEMELTGGS